MCIVGVANTLVPSEVAEAWNEVCELTGATDPEEVLNIVGYIMTLEERRE